MALLQYPENLQQLKLDQGSTMMVFTIFQRPNSQQSKLEEEIYLYMPETLQNNTNTSWEQNEVGQLARNLAKSGGETDFVGLGKDRLVKQGLKLIRNKAGENRTEFASQNILNPYIAMTFKGLNFRQFEVTFKFTPHTLGECETIQDIIKSFRRASLPTLTNKVTIGYPSEIDVAYMGQGSQWLFKYKRCVLMGVDVNYAGAGFYASMENGFPAQTEMTLRFSENELITAGDIEDGY